MSNTGGGTVSGLSVGTISYDSSASGWLATPVLGSTAAPTTITLNATTGSLAAGTYTATIPVTSTSASNSPQTITVTFVVSDVPATPSIDLSSDSLTFTGMAGGADPAASTVNVTNGGGGSLTALDVAVITYGPGASGWLNPVGLADSTAPTMLTIQPRVGGLVAGTYQATVELTSPVASNSPAAVSVVFTVTSAPAAPSIVLSSSTVGFSATQSGADPTAATLNISNGGGGTLSGLTLGTITYGSGASGWLTAGLAATTAPTTLTLQPTTGSLAAGTYTATVPVTSAVAANSPQSVTVTFTVAAPPPSMVVTPSTASFTATAGGGDPPSQGTAVTNGGGGTLSGIAVGSITYGPGASGWLGATLGSTAAPVTLTLQPTTGSLTAGTYTATVAITSAVAANSPQTVAVTFTVSAPAPLIVLGTSGVGFTAIEAGNSPTSQAVSVTNGGGGSLSGLGVGTISYGPGATGWLQATLGSSTAPTTLTLQPATGALPAGTYTATVPVTSAAASNSSVNLTVTFTIASAWIKGWNFRATPGFVSDGPNETWFTSFDAYPVSRNGVTFGTSGGSFESRDRTNTLDRRLAGQIQVANASPTQGRVRINVPGPGDYRVRLAVGDAGFAQSYQSVVIRDGIGGPAVVTIDEPAGTGAGQWLDASGVTRTASGWVANNQAVVISVTGQVIEVVVGEPGTAQTTSSTISHLLLQKLTP